MVNSPHNPTGSVMAADQMRELAYELDKRSILLVSDEVFHRLYFKNEEPSAATVPGAIVVGDMSKCLSLPGLRVGWIIDADPKRRQHFIEARDHFSISGSPLMEALAALALREHTRFLDRLSAGACANLASLEQFMESLKKSDTHPGLPPKARGDFGLPVVGKSIQQYTIMRGLGQGGRSHCTGQRLWHAPTFPCRLRSRDPGDFNKALGLMANVLTQAWVNS